MNHANLMSRKLERSLVSRSSVSAMDETYSSTVSDDGADGDNDDEVLPASRVDLRS